MTNDEELLRVINASGFPLQIALQNAVSESVPNWTVIHKEHAWRNRDDDLSGFIDFVVQHKATQDCVVVECKRVQNASWLFLGHSGKRIAQHKFKVWATVFNETREKYIGWADLALPLATPEAQFCCVRGQSTNDKNTFLERVAGELISSTEALAIEERDYRNTNDDSCRLYFSVIVTTAKLYFADFDASALSINDGTVSKATFEELPYLRVRKQFSCKTSPLTQDDYRRGVDLDVGRENTVFVVNASHFTQFLADLDVEKVSITRLTG